MSTSIPLPPECLTIVIQHLADEHDTTTLATLLRVNHYFCSVTLPILYQNPFKIIVPLPGYQRRPAFLFNLVKLAQVLLLSLPQHCTISDGLRIAYLSDNLDFAPEHDDDQEGDDQPSSSTESLLPYYSFISEISFQGCTTPRIGLFRNHFLNSNQAFRDYLENRPIDPDLIFWGARFDILAEDAGRELRRDLTWALCCANAKHIKSMVIPLYDIDRYLSAVHQFEALADVVFLLDSQYKPGNMSSSEEEGVRLFQQSKRTKCLEKMILFIQEHQRIHGPTLRTAQYRSRNEDENIPEEFKQQLFQLLRPLKDPRFLDASNWDHFLAKFQETNLSFVQLISPDLDGGDDAVMERLVKQGPFLHRCRSLDAFIMDSVDDDMFQWAVDERRIYDTEVAAGRTPHTSLVPLRLINVSYYHKSFGSQLNDVVFAFDKTLEIITTSSYWQPRDINNQEPSEFMVGNSFASWNLPKLRKLSLSSHCYPIFLRIAPDLISRLPQLTHLTLTDKRRRYRLSEIVCWHAASLVDLEELRMEGTPAISFNPETLRTARNLVRMEFRMVNTTLGPYPHVPPAQELEECFGEPINSNMTTASTTINSTTTTPSMSLIKRPIWTWDWNLPMLTSLFLNAQFAYTFQFRMLARTPNLKNIVVDSRSYSRLHQRTIVLSDFLVPGFDHPSLATMQDKERQFQREYASENNEDNSHVDGGFHALNNYFAQEWTAGQDDTQEEEIETWFNKFDYVELPALESFILRGTWTMSRFCLAVLFRRMIPNIKNLMMQGPRGYGGKDFVESSWKYLLRLEESYAALNIDSKAMVEEVAGMTFMSGGDFYYRFRAGGKKVVYYFR